MTTKKELQQQLARQEAETAKLRKQIEAMKDDVRKGNDLLFYPEVGEYFSIINQHCNDNGYSLIRFKRLSDERDYPFPKYKDEKRARRVAWGRGQLDIWKAMGEDYKAGLGQWVIFGDGDIASPYYQAQKAMWGDALFPTYEAAQQALEDFGGIDKLNEARLAAQWGV